MVGIAAHTLHGYSVGTLDRQFTAQIVYLREQVAERLPTTNRALLAHQQQGLMHHTVCSGLVGRRCVEYRHYSSI